MIPGIVLAAGRSSRFGRPKALLPAGDRTFVSRILATLEAAGVAGAVVVGRPDDEALRDEVERAGVFARMVTNPRADEGQLSSLLAGLAAADRPGVRAVLVTLVDLPLVQARTVRALIERARETQAPIVRLSCGGRHGHPVVFARATFDALRHADPNLGAKTVLRVFEHAIVTVEVTDAGIFEDVDTAEDYVRLFGREP